MNKLNYQIYCLYHNKVTKRYYGNQIDQITFVKMDKGPYVFKAKKHIYLNKETWFHPIGKEWAEYEFYYSLYQGYKKGLIELPEYLGFIQYDMEFKGIEDEYKNVSIIDFIDGLIRENKINSKTLISFKSYDFWEIYNQNIIMDPKRPEVKSDIKFENCYDTIIKEYNIILNKKMSLSTLKESGLDMCSSFFIHRDIFVKMAEFISVIVEDGRLNNYKKEDRMQSGLMERYVSVFIGLSGLNKIVFSIFHYGIVSNQLNNSYKNKLIHYIIFWFGKIGIYLKLKTPYFYKILKPYFPNEK
jgi:hypothetical protein